MSLPRTRAASHAIGILLGLFLGSAGVMKLLDVPRLAESYAKAGQPRWVFFGSGVIEIMSGVALLIPRSRLYGAWTLLGMIFLINWRPWAEHDLFFLVPQSATIGLLVFLVWLLQSRRFV